MLTYCYFADRQNGYVVSDTMIEWQADFLNFQPLDESELKRLVVPKIKERFKQIEQEQETLKSIEDELPYEVPNLSDTKEALEKERENLYVKYKGLEEHAEIYPELLREIEKDIASIEDKINECNGSSRGLRKIMDDCGLGHNHNPLWGWCI